MNFPFNVWYSQNILHICICVKDDKISKCTVQYSNHTCVPLLRNLTECTIFALSSHIIYILMYVERQANKSAYSTYYYLIKKNRQIFSFGIFWNSTDQPFLKHTTKYLYNRNVTVFTVLLIGTIKQHFLPSEQENAVAYHTSCLHHITSPRLASPPAVLLLLLLLSSPPSSSPNSNPIEHNIPLTE